MTILAGSGSSHHSDAYKAGQEAAASALAALAGYTPQLVIVFTTEHYDHAIALQGIRASTGTVPLIGCCTGGLITAQGILERGVAALALYGDDLEVALALEPDLSTRPAQAAQSVAEQLEDYLAPLSSPKHSTALIFTDGLTGALAMDTAIHHVATIFGPFCPLIGGAAGDNLQYQQTSLFVNERILGDSIALALLTTAAPIGIGVRHGWQPIGQPCVITRSMANVIYELDGRPALEVYRSLFPHSELTLENFREFTRYHPIGFPQATGEFLVRLPMQANADGSIVCVGMLPEYAVMYIMQGDPVSLLTAAEAAAQQAMTALQGVPVAAAIVIDCVTRPPLLGTRTADEIDHIRAIVGLETPIIGMYSFGEIAADTGPVCFHNKTVVVGVIGKH